MTEQGMMVLSFSHPRIVGSICDCVAVVVDDLEETAAVVQDLGNGKASRSSKSSGPLLRRRERGEIARRRERDVAGKKEGRKDGTMEGWMKGGVLKGENHCVVCCHCQIQEFQSTPTLYVFIGSPSILTSSRCDENCGLYAGQETCQTAQRKGAVPCRGGCLAGTTSSGCVVLQ